MTPKLPREGLACGWWAGIWGRPAGLAGGCDSVSLLGHVPALPAEGRLISPLAPKARGGLQK